MTTRRERLRRTLSQLPLFAGLVVLWMLLWGDFSWLTLVTGAGVAALVSLGFYLPAVQLGGRANPWRVLVFFAHLVFDIARASVQVAALALSPNYRASNAILAIRLQSRSDLIATWTAVSTSIVPGSVVIDIDPVDAMLYLHVLNMRSIEETERFRQSVLATERRIVLAIGSAEDVRRLRQEKHGARRDHEERGIHG